MLNNVIILGLGGFFGAISRYLLSTSIQNMLKDTNFPYGTLAVNVLGCFALGALAHLAETKGLLNAQTHLFLLVGFVGAFTTFSTFSLESASLLQSGRGTAGLLNIFGSNLLGLAFVFIGQFFAAKFW